MNKRGVTLLELMIVVGIIAMGAMVVGPNYQKMQAKSRQAEAKANLSSSHALMKAYFASVGTYTACFLQLGFDINNAQYYHVATLWPGAVTAACGFKSPYTTSCQTYKYGSDGTSIVSCPASGVSTYHARPSIKKANASVTVNGCYRAPINTYSAISRLAYTMVASGSVSNSSAVCDTWTIDQDKQLLNRVTGL